MEIVVVLRFFLIIFILFSSNSRAEKSNNENNYKTVTVANFNNVIWSFSFINKNEILVSLRKGDLYYFNILTNEKIKLNIPKVEEYGQGGLLDIHLKNIDGTKYIYYTFSEKLDGLVTTSLARGIYQTKAISEVETLFSAKTDSDKKQHFGS